MRSTGGQGTSWQPPVAPPSFVAMTTLYSQPAKLSTCSSYAVPRYVISIPYPTKFIFPHNNFLVYTLNIIQCHNTAPTVQWRSECSETEATLEC